ncbi:unnamed protein product [Paramecium pentaurelia]|uniref:Uncharacterized protein n=1 Tax=Paramecium pentaurelia TaxID=43138 RepID=A0A8S1S0L7_9CILI|nr:unnamed protein product [Paramecium pentaurelia]
MKKVQPGRTWTKQEDNQLLQGVEIYGRDWDKIAKVMNIKSKPLLEERYKNLINQKPKPIWELNEDILLLQMVDKLGKDWEMVQKVVKTKDIASCKRRFAKIRDSCLNLEGEDKDLVLLNQYWYKEDEELLLFLYELYNGDWSEIFKRIPERYPKYIQDQFKQKGLANQLHKWNNEKDARLLGYAFYGIPLSNFEQETGFSVPQCEERLKKLLYKISKSLQQPKKTKEQQQFDEIMQFSETKRKPNKSHENNSMNQLDNQQLNYYSEFQAALNQSKSQKQNQIQNRIAQKLELETEYQNDDDFGIVLDEDFVSD